MNKKNKMRRLGITCNANNIPDKYVNTLFKMYIGDEPIQEIKIDRTTSKYKLLLEYINKILKNMNKDLIDDVTDFKRIDRMDICTETNRLMLVDMKAELFKIFKKVKYNYYNSNGKTTQPLNVLRGMCKELNIDLVRVNTKKYIKKIKLHKDVILYSIQLKCK